jgi:hypothetical protein
MSAMGGKLTEAQCEGAPMRLVAILWMAAMIALIVGLDVTLFKNHFYERLAVNVGIVLVFAAFYFRFLRHP